ncbi:MAG TPA: 30S ribosomal protein S6--L-glutamate ligase, partial [Gemmataceae bacterium]|nr:30S ribosomal protein S6--L-glutamate ligase [Gemmataceae bacterium]
MHIAVLSAGTGWHVRDLQRAAVSLRHDAVAVDFRRVHAGVGAAADSLAGFDAVLVRTMPPGSL